GAPSSTSTRECVGLTGRTSDQDGCVLEVLRAYSANVCLICREAGSFPSGTCIRIPLDSVHRYPEPVRGNIETSRTCEQIDDAIAHRRARGVAGGHDPAAYYLGVTTSAR